MLTKKRIGWVSDSYFSKISTHRKHGAVLQKNCIKRILTTAFRVVWNGFWRVRGNRILGVVRK